jgi:transcriptional regulator with PAS, ATPase and Fis domain
MKQIYSLIETVAQFDTTVLIYGETGTGKELVARTIHQCSHRSGGPFVPVSCSALSSSLLESELFGHVKGAFTGAIKDRRGRFEIAKGGTVFLDEVGTLSVDIQVKLLRTVQERVVERVGSSEPIPIDVRIMAATNRNLSELVAKNQFREDLYYRLKVFQIDVPPLRERRLDIPVLADSFIERFNKLYSRKVIALSIAAKEQLMRYFWPGNVRELENAIEHAMVLATGKIIEPPHLPPEIRHMKTNGSPPPPPERDLGTEEDNVRRALAAFGGNVTHAAASLGVHRTTLWRKMRELGITKKGFKGLAIEGSIPSKTRN